MSKQLRRYHGALERALWLDELKDIDRDFRQADRVTDDDPVAKDLNAIFFAHRRRVAGKSSPAACDAILKEILEDD